jgi:hypothetical protein
LPDANGRIGQKSEKIVGQTVYLVATLATAVKQRNLVFFSRHCHREQSLMTRVNQQNTFLTLAMVCGAFVIQTNVASAQIINIAPGNVTASSEIPPNFTRFDDYIVDGSGLTGGTHVNGPPDGTMWLSTGSSFGGDDLDPSVTFDLGAIYTVTSFQVWNYNELAGSTDLTGRGVNAVTVEYGLTATLGSTVPGITNFARADATSTYTGEVFNGFAPFNARYIKFDIDSNHGGDNNFYGLSEVQFSGTVVPEPSAVVLLSLGAIALFCRRR